jgi:hypothetical protein
MVMISRTVLSSTRQKCYSAQARQACQPINYAPGKLRGSVEGFEGGHESEDAKRQEREQRQYTDDSYDFVHVS